MMAGTASVSRARQHQQQRTLPTASSDEGGRYLRGHASREWLKVLAERGPRELADRPMLVIGGTEIADWVAGV